MEKIESGENVTGLLHSMASDYGGRLLQIITGELQEEKSMKRRRKVN